MCATVSVLIVVVILHYTLFTIDSRVLLNGLLKQILYSVLIEISHDKLLIAINRKVQCYKLSLLINQLLTVGYINFADIANSELKNLEGSSQGSLLSPLFCNILLDDLDIFILDLCKSSFVERVKANSADWNAGRRYLNTP